MSQWLASLRHSLSELSASTAVYAPRLAMALLLVAVGWVIARLLRALTRLLVGRLELFLRRRTGVEGTREQRVASQLVSDIAFWVVFLLFVAAGARHMDLPVLTEALAAAAMYLPAVLGAVLILLAAFFLADFAKRGVISAATSSGVVYAELLGQVTKSLVLVVAGVLALEQLHVNSTILVTLFAILFGSLLGGATFAFGLGARTTVGNILASYYLSQTYRVGQNIQVQGITGRIIDIKPKGVLLDAQEGQVLVPAALVNDSISILVTERPATEKD